MHQLASVGAVAVLALAAASLATTACTPPGSESETTVRIGMGGTERMFLQTPARNLVFLPLFGSWETGDEYRTGLVESADFSSDGREAVLHLRPGILWHDGHPVTAEDLEYSFEVLLAAAREDCGETTVLDSLTLRVRDLDCGGDETHMPKHLTEHLDPADIASWDFWKQPVGNGPYKVVRYVPRTGFELEANPDYFLGKPPIDRIIISFVTPATAFTGVLAGSVDIQIPGSPAWAEALGPESPYRPYYEFSRSWIQEALIWQCRDPLLSDPEMRRALTMAVDRRALLLATRFPLDIVPIVDGPWDSAAMLHGTHPPLIPYSPDSARSVLERAGWTDTDGDGIRERGEVEFRFTLLIGGGGRSGETLAVLIQDYLAEIGVRADLQPMDRSVLVQRVRAGDFQAVHMRNAYGVSRRWDLGWDDPELREIEAELEFVRDPDRSAELQEARIRILQRDVPITTLYTVPAVNLIHRRIRGLPDPSWTGLYKVIGQLWVDEDWESEDGLPRQEEINPEGGAP